MQPPLIDRFYEKCIPEPNSGCWIWTGATCSRGTRGKIWAGGKQIVASRASYILFRGPIADGLHVCHSCDNGLCVNPDHLWLGTHSDNMRDMIAKGRGGNRNRNRKNEGVSRIRNKWRAYFYSGGRQFHLGTFATRDAARRAFLNRERAA